MKVLAIDPGTTESGYVVLHGTRVVEAGVMPNAGLLGALSTRRFDAELLAVEMIASYGMPVGAETFETCVWIGRLVDRWEVRYVAEAWTLIPRMAVKMHVCHTSKAKDANIRQALIDRFGGPGAERKGGALAGVKSHAWAALGVAVTAMALSAAPRQEPLFEEARRA